MAIYSYQQFEDAIKKAGLSGQFSAADLSLAQSNPDAGMSILKYKQDYNNATTDAARSLAHLGAENVRSNYGYYSGGGDGGSFYLTGNATPNDYQSSSAPTYSTELPKPAYENRYDSKIQKTMADILDRDAFSYDAETDPVYSQYRKQYAREGQRATQDALGAAAMASGGIPSSYAVTAASQAGDYYASQMADKIPQLYEAAYNRYMDEISMKRNDLAMLQGAEQSDYGKYLDQLSQYNNDRNFEYGQYLDQLSQYNTDRSFDYGQLLDEISHQTQLRQENTANSQWEKEFARQEQLDKIDFALTAAKYGNTSYLAELGILPEPATYSYYGTGSGTTGGKKKTSGTTQTGTGGDTGGDEFVAGWNKAVDPTTEKAVRNFIEDEDYSAAEWALLQAYQAGNYSNANATSTYERIQKAKQTNNSDSTKGAVPNADTKNSATTTPTSGVKYTDYWLRYYGNK